MHVSCVTRFPSQFLFQADIVGRVYVDCRLGDIPDINATGSGFYTFWYRTEIDVTEQLRAGDKPLCGNAASSGTALWLELQGGNYRVDVFANGHRVAPLPPPTPTCITRPDTDWYPSTWSLGTAVAYTPQECCVSCAQTDGCVVGTHFDKVCYLKAAADIAGGSFFRSNVTSCRVPEPRSITGDDPIEDMPGMFARRRFPIQLQEGKSKLVLAILVSPPDHPGFVGDGGQGGDHSLAMVSTCLQHLLPSSARFQQQP